MRLLLDTNILIDVLRGRKNRRRMLYDLAENGHELGISVITVAEIYAGMRPGEALETESFLSSFEAYAVSRQVALQAGKWKQEWSRKVRTLALDDLLIAATAYQYEATLITENISDFPMKEIQLYPEV